jgi:hypothetical protein
MTIRRLIIEIDDERELGPQVKAVRAFGKQEWKLVRELSGGLSIRHLQNLAASAHICERQAVRWEITVQPDANGPEDGTG